LTQKLNYLIAWFKLLKKRTSLALLVIILIASAAMIVTNYYTIKISSAARAYINGESQYSKGQKDASAYLIKYIYLGNDTDYKAFERNINIPLGDHIARIALSNKHNNAEATMGFLQGKNYPKDVANMVWLFTTFKQLPIFKKVIAIWSEGDALVNKLYLTGIQVRQKMQSRKISSAEKRSLILSINNISQQLTIKEEDFSNTLGIISSSINVYLFIADIVVILVIIISSYTYAGIMIRNLHQSKKKIIEQNFDLQSINAGLDKFVFNITHDLRSPLVSLIGLISLIDDETDMEQIKSYTLLMKDSLEKQDQFINEMLTFIQSKHTGLIKKECSLNMIIENVLTQNHYVKEGKEVHFYKELLLDQIESDSLKLQVILNNLVSNAVKYSDTKKDEQWVKVKTYRADSEAIIEIEDNGLGIRKNDQERIFDKFYLSGINKKSSGLGLYLVKDAVKQMNGRIQVKSEEGLYSRFTISIPG